MRYKRDKARKKLNELLSLADDEAFLIMVWAVDALQSKRAQAAGRYLTFPAEAQDAQLGDRYFVFKWVLETLVNELLTIPKKRPSRRGRSRTLNCSQFDTIASCANVLKDLENEEDGIFLARSSVIDMMHKIGHRQFEWQRGFGNFAQIYRSLFVFGGDLAKEHFQRTHGLTLADFFLCGLAFFGLSQDRPGFETTVAMSDLSISGATRDAALRLLAAPSLLEARKQAAAIRKAGGQFTAYRQSVLRKTPAILFRREGNVIARAPLPLLIMQRITTGLYYDLVGGGSRIWREIGGRFESYCLELLSEALPESAPKGSFKYRFKRDFDSPDIFLHDKTGAIKLAIECKAKKMSIVAKFSDDPLQEAREAFSEIIKGVVQIWRFFSHCRRANNIHAITPDAAGVVLTLDPWLQVSNYLDRVLAEAHTLATQIDPEISENDRRAIIFCTIEDLESTLGACSDGSFFEAALAAATNAEFKGWALANVHDRISQEQRQNEYPFRDRIADLLPVWKLLKDRAAATMSDRATTNAAR
ncbi:hypothetical protein [Bradyrhizobium iriomotense]|uniref:hypothetical protein n=1 Tax=Bradyrhizobium iriomotense TaxID=441950 RepID=UPI001B8A4ED6|nr:hypothetical protein [Bradyrhizobium iriomotense]MBR0783927.1 hypothetical protein [Bradyrhizobium iriomotense]